MKRAAFTPEWLRQRLTALLPESASQPLCIALSGGVDSVVLLAALVAVAPKRSSFRAVHVHHGLHPNADRWAEHCASIASELGVPLTTVRVNVRRVSGISGEAAAREARYEALAQALAPGEVLLTAHHEDDQLETVLLQLLRGAGLAGLAAMPELAPFAEGWLARPLLTRSRAELEAWARARALRWVDDDTNANEQFDRNYLRRRVLPVLRERWPSAASSVSRSARHAAEAKRLLDSVALADVERASNGAALSVQTLRGLDADRRRNAVRFWIARAGAPLPDTTRLEEITRTLLDARADANPRVAWNGVAVQRHADLLSLERTDESEERSASVQPASARDEMRMWHWHEHSRLELGAGRGVLSLEADAHGPLDLDALPATLAVGQRRGGERLRPRPRGRTRALKALFQEARVPLAERGMPLLFGGDRLLAAGDRWFDSSVQATSSTRRRGRLRWQRA